MTMAYPPAWCSRACKNALSDICIERCAIRRDGSHFDPKEYLGIMDLPRFPLHEFISEMSPRDRTFVIGLYTSMMVDQAQGRETRYERRNPHRPRSRQIPKAFESQGLLPDPTAGATPHQAGEKCEGSSNGAGEVVGSECGQEPISGELSSPTENALPNT